MKRKLLVSSICLGLAASMAANGVSAQSSDQSQTTSDQGQTQDKSKKKDTTELKAVTVTGSLIPQAQIENASPVITITTAQLEKQGFGSVYDALRAMPLATGAVQDNQFTGGFTPGAQTISLLGLDPGFTLFLINGHPMADYPLLYNGASNFVDLSSIPVGMVERIDILPGNQSAIYGSSAIAGVINVILKDHIDGYELNVRGGGYSGGGGANERLEFLGSNQFGDLTVLYGVQFNHQEPIWGYDRTLTRSNLANPDPTERYADRTFLNEFLNLSTGQASYVDPGSSACQPVSNLFGGSVSYQYRPNRGYYCGSKYQSGYSTLLNDTKQGTGYLNVKYKLNDSAELYANILYNVSSVYYSGGPYFWESNINGGGYFYNPNDPGNLEVIQHEFAPEEVGSTSGYSTYNLERSYNAWAGIRGSVGVNTTWDYDLYYARSQQNLTTKMDWPLTTAVNNFFQNQVLGPQLGTYYGYPIYKPNIANLYKALTPAQYASIIGVDESKNETYTQNLNLVVNNADLFSLPAGSVGLAGVFQIGNQYWSNPIDPRVIAGDFYGLTGTSGAGTRGNWAMGTELRVPIFSMLTADASARYDQYSNEGGGSTQGKVTYKLGLEFRPVDTLLLRGNYGTAFRAPDMSYTFGGQSGFYQGGLTDYYRCAVTQPNVPLTSCQYYASTEVFGVHTGNKDLNFITAKSFGYGAVWSPSSDFSIKADYYNVSIANEVEIQSIDTLLKQESDCLLGELPITSPTCVAAISQVQRSPASSAVPYQIQQVTVYPINIANERVSGIIASLNYKLDIGRLGDLRFDAQYNVTLKHSQQQYPGDPVIDLLRNPYYSSEFKTIANASVTWDIDNFSATLYGLRYGATPNYIAQVNTDGYAAPGAGTVAPWLLYNGSLTYKFADNMSLTGVVNNLKNSMPPKDSSWTSAPYYNEFNYNVYGRQFWLEFDYKFGGSKP